MKTANYLGIIVCGLCLGILTGISISPIVQSVITSLIAIIVTILSITSGTTGVDNQHSPLNLMAKLKQINLLPTTFFVLCFTIGSFTGIKIRTADLLGESPEQQYSFLKKNGFTAEEIKDIIKMKYLKEDKGGTIEILNKSVLFSEKITGKLDLIRLKTGKQLETELQALNVPAINSFLNVTTDSLSLEALKVFLCTK